MRYAAAVLAAAVSAGIRLAAAPLLGDRAPFTLFYLCILIAAWYLGTGPAAAALGASIVFSLFFLSPAGGFGAIPAGEWVALGLNIVISAFLIAMAELVRRSRAEAEGTRRASEGTAEALQQALKAARMSHWSWNILTGRVEFSENFEEMHGLAPGAFSGRFDSLEPLIHPDDLPAVKSAIAAALRDGQDYDIEFRVLPQDGRTVWIRGLGHPLREGGRSVRMTGVGIDVTEHKEREADRRLLAAIVDSTDDAIVSKDLTGRILSWNRSAERTFGYSAEEAIGRSIAMLMPPEGADDFFSIIGRIREGRRVEHYETVRRRKDGTIINVSLTVSPVHDEKGKVIGASKIARDITAVRAAERERQRIRDLYLGILGHDLRNPLNTIVASLYTLEKTVSPELRHVFPRLSRSAERMARMIDQLLDFTRARLGEGIALERRPANLRDVCAAVVEELEPQYPGRIRFRADRDLESDWDADRIAQALSNLVVNALDYGSPDHPVEVVVNRENGSARIEVANQGSPIPEELRPAIFEPFRRGTGDEQRSRRGLGLGLFITREIVRAHRGTIELLSEAGRTTFVLRLPLAGVAQPSV
jgi:PAS domain S-box-containing protein